MKIGDTTIKTGQLLMKRRCPNIVGNCIETPIQGILSITIMEVALLTERSTFIH